MMAESGHNALNAQLDSDQIFLEAKHRWLRPAEICEILQNYKKFRIAPEPPDRPPTGSLFLFDRKVLRHFRRDGHNWRKNKNGRTMKEAHERLKSGSVDVLHCYYSYGEDNENFQRRSYWMLEEELSHIALVHYMEVKGIPTTAAPPPARARPPLPSPQCRRRSLLHTQGNRTNFNQISDANSVPASRQNEEDISNTKVDSSAASRVQPYHYQRASPVTDKTSLNSAQASEREEAEPAYRHQASPGFQSIHELQMPAVQKMDVGSIPCHPVPISNIDQIFLEAQHRWLFPAEICEILQNYEKFHIAPEPPNRPQSGSLFLFDRKVLRYFRKDGHNWRKTKDGKTVKEAHERLKAGSIDVLHCYYAHGNDNENFQRRSYWMLEEELSHIVLVHYRDVKGNKTNSNSIRDADGIPASRKNEEDISNSEVDRSAASRFQPYDFQRASPVTDSTNLNNTQASEHEDAESAYRHQESKNPMDNGLAYEIQRDIEFLSWEDVAERSSAYQSVNFESSLPLTQSSSMSLMPGQDNELLNQVFSSDFGKKLEFGSHSDGFEERQASDHESLHVSNRTIDQKSDGNLNLGQNPYYPSHATKLNDVDQMEVPDSMRLHDTYLTDQSRQPMENDLQVQALKTIGSSLILEPDGSLNWLDSFLSEDGDDSLHVSKWPIDQKSDGNLNLGQNPYYPSLKQPLLYDLTTNTYLTDQSRQPMENDLHFQALNAVGSSLNPEPIGNLNAGDKTNNPALRQPLLDGVMRESLKKLDSFSRWMSKELGDVTESTMQPGSGAYWETFESEDGDNSGISTQVPLDNYILGPSLSQDQLFSIIDFSPNWAYSGSEIKVLIMGKFLRSQEEVENYKWACMFGELEVPAEIVGDGVLRCHTPLHGAGRVPFYITCSDRLACSEVRDFEFHPSFVEDEDSDETRLHMRFGKLLSLGSGTPQTSVQSVGAEASQLCSKISALLKDDTEWEQMSNLSKQDQFSADKVLKEKLHNWLLQKIVEGGNGRNVLDEDGQGVLHFAAALGYDWAIPPTIAAGVSVNFRDANGWTALHWAAHYGRERTVAFLITLDAAPGALTDPTPIHPSGRTPADLAASNGHKGIAGYLAESALSSDLSSLDLKNSEESDIREKAVETVSERIATPVGAGDLPHGLSLKDSLAAVRNATQAAARIHQVFRVQSFQRKQLKDYGDSEFGISDERALKTKKAGQHDEPIQAAAIRIQSKFRCWKDRKDFLLIRQCIIKIQAHVRGHQVRKNYKKVIWSVGIVEKVILRWRRKGSGLRGFKPEALAAGTSMVDAETKENDYDFLKEGRKQTEKRLQKALARVKSMVQYPEARDQYRRLRNVVSEMQDKKAPEDMIFDNPAVDFDEDLIDFEALLENDSYMPMAS